MKISLSIFFLSLTLIVYVAQPQACSCSGGGEMQLTWQGLRCCKGGEWIFSYEQGDFVCSGENSGALC
jgi:hypothetical protein